MIFKCVLASPFLLSLTLLPHNIIAAKSSANEECVAAFDIVQVQDMTASFDSLWPAMERQLGNVVDSIVETSPDSYFGFTTFGDKNVSGRVLYYPNPKTLKGKKVKVGKRKQHYHSKWLGYKEDYCLKVDVELQKPSTKDMVDAFKGYQAKLEEFISWGGGDWTESPFEALYRTLISPKLGWRTQTSTGGKVAKVAVVVTDALSHVAGDVLAVTGKELRPFDITADGIKENDNNENYDCDKVDYPTVKQVVDLVKELDVYVVLLVLPGGIHLDGKFYPAASLAKQGKKYRGADGLQLWYEDQFAEAGLKNVVVVEVDPKMHNYARAFKTALDNFKDLRCEQK